MNLITRIMLQLRLNQQLRLRRKLTKLDEKLQLKEIFPEHGRYTVGDLEILRYDADGGVDLKRFMADHVAEKRTQKFYTMMPDPAKIRKSAPQYEKPRVERVKVAEIRLAQK